MKLKKVGGFLWLRSQGFFPINTGGPMLSGKRGSMLEQLLPVQEHPRSQEASGLFTPNQDTHTHTQRSQDHRENT